MKKTILRLFSVFLFGLILVPTFALAADFRVSESGVENITKEAELKNLYTVGNTIQSEANISGDLVAAGNNINISGKVEDDLFAAGASINLKSQIGGNVRIAGGYLTIDSQIAEDLLAGGGVINLSKESTVGGDLLAAGGNLTIDGTINGKAMLSTDEVIINGTISGDVLIKNTQKVTISDNAVIGGNLKYSSPEQAIISSKAKIFGTTDYTQTKSKTAFEVNPKSWAGVLSLFGFYGLIVSFVTLLILIYLFPKLSQKFAEESFGKTLSNLGWGLILMIVTPIILVLLMVTLIGLKLAFVGGVLYFAVLVIMKIVTPLLMGALILKWIQKKGYTVNWLSALIGVVVGFVLTLIPVIGWMVGFGFYLIALGQAAQTGMAFLRAQR